MSLEKDILKLNSVKESGNEIILVDEDHIDSLSSFMELLDKYLSSTTNPR